jgi:hypothetical protein
MGLGIPLNVMQLLWINLISDIFPGLALAMEAPEPDIMQRPPCGGIEPLLSSNEKRPSNPHLTLAIGGSLLLQILSIVWPPLRNRLGLTLPDFTDTIAIGASALFSLSINELVKRPTVGEGEIRNEADSGVAH